MKELHHANILIGKVEGKEAVFKILAEDLNFNVQANPDFLLMESETFGIDDSRYLKDWASGKPLLGEIKAALVITNAITSEAQNALLKVLEEPPIGTYIFINLQNLNNILPTFLSRVRVLNSDPEATLDPGKEASKFLHSDINERFSMVRSLAFKKEGKTILKNLIKDLEEVAYKNFPAKMNSKENMGKNMKAILTAKIFSTARGSSPKMLTEWLASVL